MSYQGTPPQAVTITGDPAMDGIIFKVLVALGTLAATWLATNLKLSDPAIIPELAGVIVSILASVAVAIWGYIRSRAHTAAAVQAGANLVMSGNALTKFGAKIPPPAAGSLLPVSPQSAVQIVKDYGAAK